MIFFIWITGWDDVCSKKLVSLFWRIYWKERKIIKEKYKVSGNMINSPCLSMGKDISETTKSLFNKNIPRDSLKRFDDSLGKLNTPLWMHKKPKDCTEGDNFTCCHCK